MHDGYSVIKLKRESLYCTTDCHMIKSKLHGRFEIWNLSSSVEKYITRAHSPRGHVISSIHTMQHDTTQHKKTKQNTSQHNTAQPAQLSSAQHNTAQQHNATQCNAVQ